MTSFARPRRGVTLLELLAVTTLLAIAVGFATLDLAGFQNTAQLRAAESTVKAAYAFAEMEASRSGMPCVIDFWANALAWRKPIFLENEWTWSTPARIALPDRVRITGVSLAGSNAEVDRHGDHWRISVRPMDLGTGYRVYLKVGKDGSLVARIGDVGLEPV